MLVRAGAKTDIQEEVQVVLLMKESRFINNIITVYHSCQHGCTGLMWASSKGYTEIVKVLAEAKADPNITDEVKLCYTHYCIVQIRSRSCISLQYGDTALILATNEGHTDVVKILVDHGTDMDIKNKVSE